MREKEIKKQNLKEQQDAIEKQLAEVNNKALVDKIKKLQLEL